MLAVSCLTCAVTLARPAGEDDDTAAVRNFLVRHGDDVCVTCVDLQAVRTHLA